MTERKSDVASEKRCHQHPKMKASVTHALMILGHEQAGSTHPAGLTRFDPATWRSNLAE